MAGKPTGIEIDVNHFEFAMKLAGISKIKLAARMGINIRKLQRNLNQSGRMSNDTLEKACEVLDVHPDYLKKGSRYCATHSWEFVERRMKLLDDVGFPEYDYLYTTRIDPNGVYVEHYFVYEETSFQKKYIKSLFEAISLYFQCYSDYQKLSEDEKQMIIEVAISKIDLAINKVAKELLQNENQDDSEEGD